MGEIREQFEWLIVIFYCKIFYEFLLKNGARILGGEKDLSLSVFVSISFQISFQISRKFSKRLSIAIAGNYSRGLLTDGTRIFPTDKLQQKWGSVIHIHVESFSLFSVSCAKKEHEDDERKDTQNNRSEECKFQRDFGGSFELHYDDTKYLP